jgi:hypothetical protein
MAVFKGSFPSGNQEEFPSSGRRPVIFDVLASDRETSLLPEGYRLVLHTNPSSLEMSYTKKVERIQTRGGFVEQHWGDDTQSLSIAAMTGGFMRLYSGLSNITDPAQAGGSRRETLAYDSFLDMLALFHNNGSIYDAGGNVAVQGIIKVIFDGGVYLGWFDDFSVKESAEQPYQFELSCKMTIDTEVQVWQTTPASVNTSPFEV